MQLRRQTPSLKATKVASDIYAVSHVSTAVSTANQEVFHESERDLEDKMNRDEARA